MADYLRGLGYEVVAMNLRVGRLEIDIVARVGRTVIIVEVRHRGDSAWEGGLGSIRHRKQERVRRAGERLWRARYSRDESVDRMRFDAASVSFRDGSWSVEHAVAAF